MFIKHREATTRIQRIQEMARMGHTEVQPISIVYFTSGGCLC